MFIDFKVHRHKEALSRLKGKKYFFGGLDFLGIDIEGIYFKGTDFMVSTEFDND